MSSWNEFKADASKLASKVAVKTGEIADAATVQLKLQGLKLRLCEQYEKLGRLTYKAAKISEEDEPVDVDAQIAEIDRIKSDIKTLQEQINNKKQG